MLFATTSDCCVSKVTFHILVCLLLVPFIISFGEWTLGVVLDIYWKFEEAGNHYIARILYGLDTCSVDIGVLHTHFIVLSDNPLMQEHMNLCF